jgi:hypothetical protein
MFLEVARRRAPAGGYLSYRKWIASLVAEVGRARRGVTVPPMMDSML